ncbi:MAG: cation:proton antiporter [Actinomycetota bacterium]
MVGFSALLLCMVMGLTVANFHSSEVFTLLEDVELPTFVVFFALTGASLRLDVLTANWLIPLIYVIAWGIGKVGGVFAGAPLLVRKKWSRNIWDLPCSPKLDSL